MTKILRKAEEISADLRTVDRLPRLPIKVPEIYAKLLALLPPNHPLWEVAFGSFAMIDTPEDKADPNDDLRYTASLDGSPIPNLLHRFTDRVLFLLTKHCPFNCQYCFRDQINIRDEVSSIPDYERVAKYLVRHPEVAEFIFSGGDPFIASPKVLRAMRDLLNNADTIETVRWHSRYPVVEPARITPDFLDSIYCEKKENIIILHIIHSIEITPDFKKVVQAMQEKGFVLQVQFPLLRGVNDNPDELVKLINELESMGVQVKYVHMLDAAAKTHQWRVRITEAKLLALQIKGRTNSKVQIVVDAGPGGKVPIDRMMPTGKPGQYAYFYEKEGRVERGLYQEPGATTPRPPQPLTF